MDLYKDNFEKGVDHYINQLEEINWFDSPYVNKEETVTALKACTFAPYYGTYLTHYDFDSAYSGPDLLQDVLGFIQRLIPDFQFEILESQILITLNGNRYSIDIDVDSFELDESPTNFFDLMINPILVKEKSAYLFYELPPADQCSSIVFVKPAVYDQAIEKGLIPDFMGYYAMNY